MDVDHDVDHALSSERQTHAPSPERQTKTAWFENLKKKMVNQPEARRRRTPIGEPAGQVWHQQLQSEHYGQRSQHASGGGAGHPLQDFNMQSPGPSREGGRLIPRSGISLGPAGDGEDEDEDEGVAGDVEDNVNHDNVNHRGEREDENQSHVERGRGRGRQQVRRLPVDDLWSLSSHTDSQVETIGGLSQDVLDVRLGQLEERLVSTLDEGLNRITSTVGRHLAAAGPVPRSTTIARIQKPPKLTDLPKRRPNELRERQVYLRSIEAFTLKSSFIL